MKLANVLKAMSCNNKFNGMIRISQLGLSITNMDAMISIHPSEFGIDIRLENDIVISNGTQLAKFVDHKPHGSVCITSEERTALITSGKTSLKLPNGYASDFLPEPELIVPVNSRVYDMDTMQEMVERMCRVRKASTSTRYSKSGAILDNELIVGYCQVELRAEEMKHNVKFPFVNRELVLDCVIDLLKILPADRIHIEEYDKVIVFRSGNWTIYQRKVEFQAPNYRTLWGENQKAVVFMKVKQWKDIITDMISMTTENSKIMAINSNEIKVASPLGEMNYQIPRSDVDGAHDPQCTVDMNINMLKCAISLAQKDSVVGLHYTGPKKPVIILDPENNAKHFMSPVAV